jgi:hypothetical protein
MPKNKYISTNDGGGANGQAKYGYLVLQDDGNLVFYGNMTYAGNDPVNLSNVSKTVLWNSGTYNRGVVKACMQTDGNFVLYDQNNKAVWHTNTYGHKVDRLSVLSVNGFQLGNSKYIGVGYPWVSTWKSEKRSEIKDIENNALSKGQSLHSKNGKYRLTLQDDGNLVLYTDQNKAIWNSGTYGKNSKYLATDNSKLTLYDMANNKIWQSSAGYLPSIYSANLVLQDDGNLVLYNSNGTYAWDTKTYGKY